MEEGFELASVCNVPFDYIFSRGQGIRILATIYKECLKKGYLIPDKF